MAKENKIVDISKDMSLSLCCNRCFIGTLGSLRYLVEMLNKTYYVLFLSVASKSTGFPESYYIIKQIIVDTKRNNVVYVIFRRCLCQFNVVGWYFFTVFE